MVYLCTLVPNIIILTDILTNTGHDVEVAIVPKEDIRLTYWRCWSGLEENCVYFGWAHLLENGLAVINSPGEARFLPLALPLNEYNISGKPIGCISAVEKIIIDEALFLKSEIYSEKI